MRVIAKKNPAMEATYCGKKQQQQRVIHSRGCSGRVRARSQGTFFVSLRLRCRKMNCVDVNDNVHTVRFPLCAMQWCVQCRT